MFAVAGFSIPTRCPGRERTGLRNGAPFCVQLLYVHVLLSVLRLLLGRGLLLRHVSGLTERPSAASKARAGAGATSCSPAS